MRVRGGAARTRPSRFGSGYPSLEGRSDTIAHVTPSELIPIVGLGAGTHAKSLLDAIRSANVYDPKAIVDDDPERAGDEILGVQVVSAADGLEGFLNDGVRHAFTGVGGTTDSGPRRRVFERLRDAGFELPPIAHATASISPDAQVGPGAQIFAYAVVNAGAEIGAGVIVNTAAIVEHDCRIGAHAHIAPGALLAGLVTVGEGAHVGIGAAVIEGIRIGDGALVGAGAVVIRDVEDGARVVGVPAKPLA